MPNIKHNFFVIFIACCALVIAAACANRGAGPQGGPKDIAPPKLQKANPSDGSLGVKSPIVELHFDEIVAVDNPFEKVIISPPQSTPPVIKALGHKIKVELKDSLIDSTTYTINFTDAIVDNNERNKLDGLSIGFSTGDFIDTLQMCGTVIDAENLNPVGGILVGIHNNLHDSAFTSVPFLRISKTNAKGEFCIDNIAQGSYKIFALSDMGNNYRFDIPTERIAFNDSIFTPTAEVHTIYDSIGHFFFDSIAQTTDSSQFIIDSIITRYHTAFAPANILLHSFVEKDFRHYLVRNERKTQNVINLIFSSPCDSLPKLTPINIPDSAFKFLLQVNATADTLTYWLTDSVAIASDTLKCQLSYHRIDVDSQYTATDTLTLIYRRPKTGKNKTPESNPTKLNIGSNASTSFDFFNRLIVTSPTPAKINDTCQFRLKQKIDTIFTPLAATIELYDSIGLKFAVNYQWEPEASYAVELDSAFFVAIDSTVSHATTFSITTKSLEEYGKIIFSIKNYKGCEVIQLVDKSDKVITSIPTSAAKTTIEHLAPGTYYARLFLDHNRNGLWDTGSYSELRQPEEIYYFPYEIELRAFWDVEEDWDIDELPLLEQKPAALRKSSENK